MTAVAGIRAINVSCTLAAGLSAIVAIDTVVRKTTVVNGGR